MQKHRRITLFFLLSLFAVEVVSQKQFRSAGLAFLVQLAVYLDSFPLFQMLRIHASLRSSAVVTNVCPTLLSLTVTDLGFFLGPPFDVNSFVSRPEKMGSMGEAAQM